MKHILFLIFGITSACQLTGQNMEAEMLYPDTLRSSQDSFFVNSPNKLWSRVIARDDTLNLGTSGYKGVSMTIWTDLDTLVIPHVNFPYNQLVKIPIVSPSDTALCILRFQSSTSNISDEYVMNNKGEYSIDIPEIYELSNIILYLTDCSEKTNNHPDSEYAKRVIEYFGPYQNHSLIRALNNNCNNVQYWNTYYGFRENSICFKFKDEHLEYDTPYKHVYWDDSRIFGGQFRNMLYLVQDFAVKSNFRNFYQENLTYYEQLKERQSQLLPINQMWEWLENEFPQRMDHYKVIFSPLIGGSHSTQRFQKGFFGKPDFEECIMFINAPEKIDQNNAYSEKLKEGLMSGIVFTEIDHNYVNPTSRVHINAIKELISDKGLWATKKVQQNYSSEYAIFNEYITHSLFCLYAKEHYEEGIGDEIIKRRIQLMERRGFPQFKRANSILIKLMMNNRQPVFDLYSEIISELSKI